MRVKLLNIDKPRMLMDKNYDNVDLLLINYHHRVMFISYYDIPLIVREIKELSSQYKIAVLLHSKLQIEDETYLSVMFFDKGTLLGIADSVSDEAVTRGKKVKIFNSHLGRIGVLCGRDILYPQSTNLFAGGASIVVHMSLDPISKEHYRALRGHLLFKAGTMISGYEDCLVVLDKTLNVCLGENVVDVEPIECCALQSFLKLAIVEF